MGDSRGGCDVGGGSVSKVSSEIVVVVVRDEGMGGYLIFARYNDASSSDKRTDRWKDWQMD